MKNIFLFLFLILSAIPSFGQKEKHLFGGHEINILMPFVSSYYELGDNNTNHFGFSGGIGGYRNFYIGGYKQWGSWRSPGEANDFSSKYKHGGFWLGYTAAIKNSEFSIVPTCYLGRGESVSRQDTPVSFADVRTRFNVLTPELGVKYKLATYAAFMLSTGYHAYSERNGNDQPMGFSDFDLNQYYVRFNLRIGG